MVNNVRKHNDRFLQWDELKYCDTGIFDSIDVWMNLIRICSSHHIDICGLQMDYRITDEIIHGIDSALLSGF